jgi:signal peptidase II
MMSAVSTDRPREQREDNESTRDTAAPHRTAESAENEAAENAASGAAAENAATGRIDAVASGANALASRDADAAGTATGEAGRAAAHPRTLPALLLVAAVVFAFDLGTKALVVAKMKLGEPISIIDDVVRLTLVRNPGAAFSMATGMTWLLTLIAAAVVIGVLRIGRSLRSVGWAVGLGLVLGGAVGNLADRLFRAPGPLQGHVVDFIAVTKWWPVFNVADSCIVCGAILLVALTVFGFEPDGGRTRAAHGAGDAGERA